MEPCKVCGGVAQYILENGEVVCRAHIADPVQPTGCKVFSATRASDRAQLGERVTEWLRANKVDITDKFVRLSSDNAYHCLSITLFYREAA